MERGEEGEQAEEERQQQPAQEEAEAQETVQAAGYGRSRHYRVVQLDFTPAIEVFSILFEMFYLNQTSVSETRYRIICLR